MPIERTIHYSFFFCLCKASVSVSLWWLKHDGSERPGSKQRPQIPDQNRLTDGILWPSDYHAYCQQLVNYVTVWISPPLQAKWESDPWKMYIHLLSEHCVSRHLKCLAQHAREPEMHAGFAWAFETLVLFARNSGSNLSVVVFLPSDSEYKQSARVSRTLHSARLLWNTEWHRMHEHCWWSDSKWSFWCQ